MIKAVFFDLDGTLLTSEKRISERSKQALLQLRKNQIQTYIATARPRNLDNMLPGWTKQTFDLFDGGIFSNGACCLVSGEVKYHYIHAQAVKKMMEIVSQFPNIHFVLQMENEVHAFNYEFDETHIEEWGLQERKIVELSEECTEKTVKIMIYTNNLVNRSGKLPEKLFDLLKQEIGEKAKLYLTDQQEVILIVPNQISKYSAIVETTQYKGLSLDEIAVFGDDMNDMEMLSSVHCSVAMGNGEQVVKQTAKYVTKTNDEDGVVYALESILKLINGSQL